MPELNKLTGLGGLRSLGSLSRRDDDPIAMLSRRDLDPNVRFQILSDINEQYGSGFVPGTTPQIAEESPGLLRGAMDILSRMEYAPAAFAKSMFEGDTLDTMIVKGASELFSGVGGVQGQKTTWTDYLEATGAQNVHLGDMIPMLDDTWIGKVGTNDIAGLAMSIALDPTTYITAGAKPAAQVLLKGMGKVSLSAKGAGRLQKITKTLNADRGKIVEEILTDTINLADDDIVLRAGAHVETQADELISHRAKKQFMRENASWKKGKAVLPDDLLDRGGLRWAGYTLFDAKQVKRYVREPARKAMERFPGGKQSMLLGSQVGNALDSAMTTAFQKIGGGANSAIRGAFKTWGKLQVMTNPEVRVAAEALAEKEGIDVAEAALRIRGQDRAIIDMGHRLAQNYATTAGVISVRNKEYLRSGLEVTGKDGTKKFLVKPDLSGRYAKLNEEKFNGKLGEYIYKVLDGTALETNLSDEMLETVTSMAAEFEEIGKRWSDLLFKTGAIEAQQARWIPRRYENIDELDKYHAMSASKSANGISENYTKERQFSSYEESVYVSSRDNASALKANDAGHELPVYPILKPDYDILGNFQHYGDRVAKDASRATAHREAAMEFGIKLDDFDIEALYDIGGSKKNILKGIKESENDNKKIIDMWARVKGQRRGAKQKRLKTLNRASLADDIGWDLKKGEWKPGRGGAMDPKTGLPRALNKDRIKSLESFLGSARGAMQSMQTAGGKRELMRQIFQRIKGQNEWSIVIKDLYDFEEFFPKMNDVVRAGVDEDYLQRWYKEGDYVHVTGSLWGEGAHMIPRKLREEIENFDGALINSKAWKDFKPMLNGLDKTNNMFRFMSYTLWPASMVRDLYSGMAVNFFELGKNALDPEIYTTAGKMIAYDEKINRRAFSKFAGGAEDYGKHMIETPNGAMSIETLYRSAVDYGVMQPGEVFAEMADTGAAVTKLGRKAHRGVVEATRARGQIDNFNRFVMYLGSVKRGMPAREAADRVREMHFMYQELSKFEREIMKRGIPFYTFTRKAISLSLKELQRRPGPMLASYKAFRGSPSENQWMAKWEQDGMRIRLGGDGDTVHMLNGIDLPYSSLNTLWGGNIEDTVRNLVGMVSPVFRVPAELMTGQSMFSGQSLARQHNNAFGAAIDHLPVPGAVKDWLGYRKDMTEGGRPSYSFNGSRMLVLMQMTMMGRVSSTARRMEMEGREADTVGASASNMLVNLFTGMRYREFNLEIEQGVDTRRRVKELEQQLVNRGAMMQYQQTYMPKNQGELR